MVLQMTLHSSSMNSSDASNKLEKPDFAISPTWLRPIFCASCCACTLMVCAVIEERMALRNAALSILVHSGGELHHQKSLTLCYPAILHPQVSAGIKQRMALRIAALELEIAAIRNSTQTDLSDLEKEHELQAARMQQRLDLAIVQLRRSSSYNAGSAAAASAAVAAAAAAAGGGAAAYGADGLRNGRVGSGDMGLEMRQLQRNSGAGGAGGGDVELATTQLRCNSGGAGGGAAAGADGGDADATADAAADAAADGAADVAAGAAGLSDAGVGADGGGEMDEDAGSGAGDDADGAGPADVIHAGEACGGVNVGAGTSKIAGVADAALGSGDMDVEAAEALDPAAA